MADNDKQIRRLSWARLIEHHINALTFFALVATGMAQRFFDAPLSRWFIDLLGGINNVRWLHRGLGVIFGIVFVQHVLLACWLVFSRRSRPSMLVTLKDFGDVVRNLRYYFGITKTPAQCDRYDYKQKFEYWGVLMGGVVMVVTGLILWFPTALFQWLPFLPSQIVPASKVAHSNEAMMAFLIIVIWHIFNAIFSPEVFPFDKTILNGNISRERMRHEHPLELQRIEAGEEEAPK